MDTLDTRLQQAVTLHRQGQAEGALAICREILRQNPAHAGAHNVAGVSALSLGDLGAAETAFRAALESEPGHFEARANLGQVLALRGDNTGAESAFRQALEQRPGSPAVLNALGLLLARHQRSGEALELYAEALARDSDNASTFNNMGAALMDRGDTDAAIKNFRRVLELQPRHVNAMYNLAVALKKTSQLEEALGWCERALEIQPANAAVLNVRGGIFHERTELEAAVENYRAAIDSAPGFASAHNNLGNALRELGRTDEAIQSFRTALGFEPRFDDAQYNLAALYQAIGDFDAAVRNYESLLARNADFVAAYNGLQSCLLYLHRPKAVLDACGQCRSRFPNNQFSVAHEAFAAMQLGDESRFDYLYPLDRFPHAVSIDPPEGFGDVAALNRQLARDVLSHPSLKTHHDEHTGTTTRRFAYGILDQPTPAVSAFANLVRHAVDEFIQTLPSDPEHPFYGHPPGRFSLKMWATVLNSGGIHGAHNHEHAWLSGVYYVLGSSAIHDGADPEAGWIEFDGFSHLTPSELFRDKARIVEPKDGLMLLFPAYFLHGTVPFYSDDTRVSIAFDVQPLE